MSNLVDFKFDCEEDCENILLEIISYLYLDNIQKRYMLLSNDTFISDLFFDKQNVSNTLINVANICIINNKSKTNFVDAFRKIINNSETNAYIETENEDNLIRNTLINLFNICINSDNLDKSLEIITIFYFFYYNIRGNINFLRFYEEINVYKKNLDAKIFEKMCDLVLKKHLKTKVLGSSFEDVSMRLGLHIMELFDNEFYNHIHFSKSINDLYLEYQNYLKNLVSL